MNKCIRQQQGQSLAETLIVMVAILLFFTVIPWLGRLIDINLHQTNASSYAAFQFTRQLDGVVEEDIKQRFFIGTDKNWRNRRQELIVNPEQVQISIDRSQKLSADMQAGMQSEYAQTLRQEWQIEDQGIVNAQLQVTPFYGQVSASESSALGLNLGFVDSLQPRLRAHTAILSDAAHSSTDIATHQRTAWSDLAWSNVSTESYEIGKKIQSNASPVDRGFDRADPVFDWLVPWAGKLPAHHTQSKPFEEKLVPYE